MIRSLSHSALSVFSGLRPLSSAAAEQQGPNFFFILADWAKEMQAHRPKGAIGICTLKGRWLRLKKLTNFYAGSADFYAFESVLRRFFASMLARAKGSKIDTSLTRPPSIQITFDR